LSEDEPYWATVTPAVDTCAGGIIVERAKLGLNLKTLTTTTVIQTNTNQKAFVNRLCIFIVKTPLLSLIISKKCLTNVRHLLSVDKARQFGLGLEADKFVRVCY